MIQLKSEFGEISVSSAVFSNITGMAATRGPPLPDSSAGFCILPAVIIQTAHKFFADPVVFSGKAEILKKSREKNRKRISIFP